MTQAWGCQVDQEDRDTSRKRVIQGMPLAVKEHELLNPEPLAFLGSLTEEPMTAGGMNLPDYTWSLGWYR